MWKHRKHAECFPTIAIYDCFHEPILSMDANAVDIQWKINRHCERNLFYIEDVSNGLNGAW